MTGCCATLSSRQPADPMLLSILGMSSVSKAQRQWLEARPPTHYLAVAADLQWQQPDHLLSAVYRVAPLHFCTQLHAALAASAPGTARHSQWRDTLVSADRAVAALLRDTMASEQGLLEGRAVLALAELLPESGALYVSNSMSVRDLDAFLPLRDAPLDIFCNRGVNGIDGVLSSALGAAAGGDGLSPIGCEQNPTARGPLTLLIGDLALLHDIGALLSAHQLGLKLTIIVFNNDGGAIFSYLPIAAEGQRVGFDQLFTVPHGLEFDAAASLYGLSYSRVDGLRSFCQAVCDAQAGSGTSVIEVSVDTAASVGHRRALVEQVAGVLRQISCFD